jgi:ankyrin repeat protein
VIRTLFSKLFAAVLPPNDLWRAAEVGDVDAIKRLVTAGANPNQKKQSFNIEGDTALHLAARSDKPEAIRILIELGAKVNAKDNHGSTALMVAAANNASESTIDLLLDLGADINAQDKAGGTALTAAAFCGKEKAVAQLLKRGADPNQAKGTKKSEALTHAIWSKNRKVFDLLISAGVHTGNSGDVVPAIQSAALSGLDEYVEQLLKAGADPNTKDSEGFPTIISAVRGKNFRTLQLLIDAGADVNARDSAMETALDIAYKIKQRKMIELLEDAGGKRGLALPKTDDEPERKSIWQLTDNSMVSARIEPWPARHGKAVLRVTVTGQPALADGWSIQYRIRREDASNEPWVKMFPAAESGDDDEEFEAEICLERGTSMIDLQVSGRMHREPDVLSDWKINVK